MASSSKGKTTSFEILIGDIHTPLKSRVVIKRRVLGISSGYCEHLPRLLSEENKRKIEPKEIPSCLILVPLVVFTRQLAILVTTLP